MKTKEAFEKYLDFGYKPILLHHNTKIPIFFGWQKKYNYKTYYDLLNNSNKKYNIGFLLGEIVDIEGDTEEANEILNRYFLTINHPIYKSKKSYHHLFKNSYRNISRIQINNFEIRGFSHQSVVPPSNVDYAQEDYIWTEDLIHFNELPEIPKDFTLDFKISSLKTNIKKNKHDKSKSGIWCYVCKNKFLLNKQLLNTQIKKFKLTNQKWKCKICKSN